MELESKDMVETGLVVHLELGTEAMHRSINGYIAHVGDGEMGVEVPKGGRFRLDFALDLA